MSDSDVNLLDKDTKRQQKSVLLDARKGVVEK